jgi:hypothetical protein
MTVTWTVVPSGVPTVLKHCGRCGREREFICSGSFRINAQKKKLDIWLIYRCNACGSAWNMDILSRVNTYGLERSLYDGFLKNDPALVAEYALDPSVYERNGVAARYDGGYSVSNGERLPEGPAVLNIKNEFGLKIRLDKILSEKLGVSRNEIMSLFESGVIRIENPAGRRNHPRLVFQSGVSLHIGAGIIKNIKGRFKT